jgi:hypothetical protein
MTDDAFGSCCEALAKSVAAPNSFFRQEEDGVWYLTIGYVNTPNGIGFFDEALIHCPFCGAKLQDSDEIERKSSTVRD